MPELTDEIRQAVHEEDCARAGHAMEIRNAIAWENPTTSTLKGPPGQLPHLHCGRCGRVWLVVGDEPGTNYEDALAKFRSRVKAGREPRP